MADLGTLGGTFSDANAINSLGQVAGESSVTGSTASHAFIYVRGEYELQADVLDAALAEGERACLADVRHGDFLSFRRALGGTTGKSHLAAYVKRLGSPGKAGGLPQ